MNYLYELTKKNKFNTKKKKANILKTYIALGVLGVAIAGTVATLFTKNCCKEIENIVINNAENNDEYIDNVIDDDIDEEEKKNRNEIKETLEHVNEDALGDVGLALEDALEEFEEEKGK